MKQSAAIIYVLLFFSFTSTLQAQQAAEVWKIQKDSTYNFTFSYPTSWELKLPGTTTRFFVTTKAENDSDYFRENINCIARQLQQRNFKITEAESDIKNTLASNLKNYKLIYSGYSTWNNAQTLTLEYTCSKESNGVNYDLHLQQRIAIVKDILFTFTYTAASDKYEKFITTINRIFKSVKML